MMHDSWVHDDDHDVVVTSTPPATVAPRMSAWQAWSAIESTAYRWEVCPSCGVGSLGTQRFHDRGCPRLTEAARG